MTGPLQKFVSYITISRFDEMRRDAEEGSRSIEYLLMRKITSKREWKVK